MKVACEIFADRNYDDKGYLISRNEPNALITNPIESSDNVISMLDDSSIKCFSGKRIPCNINSICVHGDGKNALIITEELKKKLTKQGFLLKPLDQLTNFF